MMMGKEQVEKNFSGGKLPSDDFGVNAAWWHIMILATSSMG